MAQVIDTVINTGNVILKSGEFKDQVLTAAANTTYLMGTILARAATGEKMIPYVAGGEQVPAAVLTYDVDAIAAGDVSIRPMISGVVRKQLLIIHADGDDSNVDAEVLDLLRSRSIVSVDVQELSEGGLTP